MTYYRRDHSQSLDRVGCRREFTAFELLRQFHGCIHVFCPLTEMPIIQGLLASGMGKGPALALLLAGPSLSLPNMLVISGVMGAQKTIVYVALVIIMATISGYIFGSFC